MWTLLLGVTFGLLASCRSEQLHVKVSGCSYARVFLIEGVDRYTLTFDKAKEACDRLNSTLATLQQLQDAYAQNMETCRNGWIINQSMAILRHTHHINCAVNMTGLFLHAVDPDEHYDAYCYDEKADPEYNCDKITLGELLFSLDAPDQTTAEPVTVEDPDQTVTPTVGGQAEPETTEATRDADTAQPEDTSDGTGGGDPLGPTETNPSAVPTSTKPEETAVSEGAATENPADGQVEGNETLELGSTMTPVVVVTKLEEAAGSGMEDRTFASTPVGEPEETQQPSVATDQQEEITQPEDTEDREQPASGKTGSGTGEQPTSAGQESSGSSWLILIGVIVAVCAVLLVCAAVAKRNSWCGKQQTLMITPKDGSEGNGAAASAAATSRAQEREQEMVTLMNKENIQENGNTEEFTVITLEESPDKEQLA